MIIYEVNLTIEENIYGEYCSWLTDHISLMMKQQGFIGYNMSADIEKSGSYKSITIWYYLDNIDSLNNYLKNYSKDMRNDGINKFGDKFSASRRVFESKECFVNAEYLDVITKNSF